MVRVVYSKRISKCYRNPALLIYPDSTSNDYLMPGDEPVSVWKFDDYHEAVEFVHEHYDTWRYSRGWDIKPN